LPWGVKEIFQLDNIDLGAGQGQIIAVVGEPGVGKSRLFFEFVQSHYMEGWLVVQASTPYLPLIDLLKAYFKVDPSNWTKRSKKRCRRCYG
jgi:KaiC/GvpD/RAD55 family RecA-like ATPase